MSSFDPRTLPTGKPLIFICRSGNRSGQVADIVAAGQENVFNMIGGMKAWDEVGLSMISSNGNPEVT